jgi:hypothetical protein
MIKLRKASLRKSFCIAKITEVQIDNRVSKVPIVCINLGLYDDQQEAKNKCQELNVAGQSQMSKGFAMSE